MTITSENLSEYEQYRGYYDGFYLQKVKNGLNITSDEEWHLIASLIQDHKLVRKGLASARFEEELGKKLKDLCDNEETIQALKHLALQSW